MRYIKSLSAVILALVSIPSTLASYDFSEIMPADIIQIVMTQPVMEPIDLCRCAQVSRKFRLAADSDAAWAHIPLKLNAEIIGLFVKNCIAIQALYKEVYLIPPARAIPAEIPRKMRHRLYVLICTQNNEAIKNGVCQCANSVSLALTEYRDDVPLEVLESLQSLKQQFSLSSIALVEELLLFSEQFSPTFLSAYLSSQKRQLISLLEDAPEPTNLGSVTMALRELYDRFINRGSKLALKAKEDLQEEGYFRL